MRSTIQTSAPSASTPKSASPAEVRVPAPAERWEGAPAGLRAAAERADRERADGGEKEVGGLRAWAGSVVAVGGGSGLSVLLRGLKHHVAQAGSAEPGELQSLTAVVTVADDGGSSGRLRRELGGPAPGDIRSCIVALADDENLLSKLFQYRFGEGRELAGHSFGNLFLTALAGVTGDFYQAIVETEHILSVRGRILPSTLVDVNLRAVGVSGKVYDGESAIGSSGERLADLRLDPPAPPAFPRAVEAILGADLVVLGPGSLYTSILPNLMIPGIREALRQTRANVLLLMNLMTQPGETDEMDAVAHLEAIERWAEPGLVDAVLVNATAPPLPLLDLYGKERSVPVLVDERRIAEHGVQVLVDDLLGEGELIRHDPDKLARAVLALAPLRHDPASDPVVVATRAALRERGTP